MDVNTLYNVCARYIHWQSLSLHLRTIQVTVTLLPYPLSTKKKKQTKTEHEVNYIFLEFSKLHVIFPHAASLNWTA